MTTNRVFHTVMYIYRNKKNWRVQDTRYRYRCFTNTACKFE